RALRARLDHHAAQLVAHLHRAGHERVEDLAERAVAVHVVEVRAADAAVADGHTGPRRPGQRGIVEIGEGDGELGVGHVVTSHAHRAGRYALTRAGARGR